MKNESVAKVGYYLMLGFAALFLIVAVYMNRERGWPTGLPTLISFLPVLLLAKRVKTSAGLNILIGITLITYTVLGAVLVALGFTKYVVSFVWTLMAILGARRMFWATYGR